MGRRRHKQPKRKALRVVIPDDVIVALALAVKEGKITMSRGRELLREEIERRTIYEEPKHEPSAQSEANPLQDP